MSVRTGETTASSMAAACFIKTSLQASWIRVCFAINLVAAIPLSGTAQNFDSSGTANVKGAYFVREVLLSSNPGTGAIAYAQSLTGIMTFDGASHYMFSGQMMDSRIGSPTTYPFSSGYNVSSSGLIVFQNPLISRVCSQDATACEWGGIGAMGPNAVVANPAAGSVTGIFIAIPIGPNVSTSNLNGNYRAGFLDFPGANARQVRDGYFALTSAGDGMINDIVVNGTIANKNDGAATQTLNGVTYSVSGGIGTLNLPTPLTPSSALLSGQKTFYVSADGNLLLGGAVDGFDIIAGVKATTGRASSALFNGTYYTTSLEDIRGGNPPDMADSYFGSIRAVGAGTSIAHSRSVFFNGGGLDYTFDGYLPFASDGTVRDSAGVEHMLAVNGQAILAVASGSAYSLTLGLQAKNVTGSGVFIDPMQVFNAGSNAPITNPVAPGEYVTLKGENLATGIFQPSMVPFPANLGGTSVTVNGRPAALSYVSPGQINIQVPYETSEGYATFQVSNNGTKSNQVTLYTQPTAPGVFTLDFPFGIYGDGSAAVQHSDYSIVSASNPARAGETLILYVTGPGATSPAVSDGAAAPSTLAAVTQNVSVSILDYAGNFQPAVVTFKGLTPNAVGLYQINFVVPSGLAAGMAYVGVNAGSASTFEAKIYLGSAVSGSKPEHESDRRATHVRPTFSATFTRELIGAELLGESEVLTLGHGPPLSIRRQAAIHWRAGPPEAPATRL